MFEGFGSGVLFGALAMWGYAWWSEPTSISNAKKQLDGAIVLEKVMSGQVALIHGFISDLDVCSIIKEGLESDGGYYVCTAQNAVAKSP